MNPLQWWASLAPAQQLKAFNMWGGIARAKSDQRHHDDTRLGWLRGEPVPEKAATRLRAVVEFVERVLGRPALALTALAALALPACSPTQYTSRCETLWRSVDADGDEIAHGTHCVYCHEGADASPCASPTPAPSGGPRP